LDRHSQGFLGLKHKETDVKTRFSAIAGLMVVALLVPSVSQAALKAYKSGGLPNDDSLVGNFELSPIFGTSNFGILRTSNLSPSVQPTPGNPDFFEVVLDDPAGGVVSIVNWEFGGDTNGTTNLTGFAGPAGFIFIRSTSRIGLVPGQTGAGSTTSSIDWGVLTGWSSTGGEFCNSSPPFVCTFAAFQEDMTIPAVVNSSTYDIGTWTFDSTGDFDATRYVTATHNPATTNILSFLDGKLFGTTLPALPIVGFGALALGLLVVGGRSLMRGKE
jgi:hypothetical protein